MITSLCKPVSCAGYSLFFFVAFTARADILLDNTDEPTRSTTEITPTFWAAQAFITDDASYSLESIDTLFGNHIDDAEVVAELHADLDANVGPYIASFVLDAIPAGVPTLMNLPLATPVLLSPNTQYWLVVGVTSISGAVGWDYAEGNFQTGPGVFGAYSYSDDSGLSWPVSGIEDPYKLRVNATPVSSPDSDGDGIVDALDNCLDVPNPDQRDSNGDGYGYGNPCDADLDNNCVVNFLDLGILKSVIFSGHEDADLDGSGAVNFVDLGIMKSRFFMPPGPSGLPTACSP